MPQRRRIGRSCAYACLVDRNAICAEPLRMPTARPCISQLKNNKFRLRVMFKKQEAQPIFDTFNEASSELDRCAVFLSETSKLICRLKVPFVQLLLRRWQGWKGLGAPQPRSKGASGSHRREGPFRRVEGPRGDEEEQRLPRRLLGVEGPKVAGPVQANVPGPVSGRGGGRTSL